MKVLYISYDGLTDNLGRSQIIPYIAGLSKSAGVRFTVLTFEKKGRLQDAALTGSIRDELSAAGAIWIPLPYHKSPALVSTAYDILRGVAAGTSAIRKNKLEFTHGRSFIGSVIAQLLKKINKNKVIFDVRGFWPEERVEAGIWKKEGGLFKASKAVEKSLIRGADEIVTLTARGRDELSRNYGTGNKNITVIPTCVDVEKVAPAESGIRLPEALRDGSRFVVAYIGSVSTWYMPDEMFRFFGAVKKAFQNSFFLVLTGEKDFLENRAGRAGPDVSVMSVDNNDVAGYLCAARVGLAFYKPGYSRRACCPTKLGEYLNCGIPVVINAGVGDSEEIISGERVGVVISGFSENEYERAVGSLRELLSEGDTLRRRCMEAARKYFSLQMGIDRYRSVYERMAGRQAPECA